MNRLTRGTFAQTRRSGTTPVDQARNAQAYANEYEAANQVYGQKYNADSQIDQNFMNQQNELRMRAGTNKAQALNTLADRTAKGHSAFTDRWINAISGIGTKEVAQQAENRASILYQDMFPNFGYGPNRGSSYRGGPANLSIKPSVGDTPGATYEERRYQREMAEAQDRYLSAQDKELGKSLKPPKERFGGKARLPKKSPKRK